MKRTDGLARRGFLAQFEGATLFGSAMNSIANPIIFSDSFSTDLAAWTGKNDGAHQGVIVSDPFDVGNKVLSFSGLNLSGDIFTANSLSVGAQGQTVVAFDYLGLPQAGSVAGNLGGFFGISIDLLPEGGDAAWIAGTELSAVNGLGFTGIELLDDGLWHRYEVDISSILSRNSISSIYLMLEDWRVAGGVAGDVYFDNIEVKVVSVPDSGASATLFVLALTLLSMANCNRINPVTLTRNAVAKLFHS